MNELIERIKQFNIDVKREIDIVEERVVDFLSRWKGPIPQVSWSTWIDDKSVSFELEWYQDKLHCLSLHFYSRHDLFFITPQEGEKYGYLSKNCPTDAEILEIVKDYALLDGHMTQFWR